MRYTRKVFAVCICTALAVVASLLVALPASLLVAKPASAAPAYPAKNPGTDLTHTFELPVSATTALNWARNVMAPQYHLPSSASMTAIAQAMATEYRQTPLPPATCACWGGGPVPTLPPRQLTDQITVTVTSVSTTTSVVTTTVTKALTTPLVPKELAAVVGFVGGMGAYVGSNFIMGFVAARGMNLDTTDYASFAKQRKGFVTWMRAIAFGIFNLAFLAVDYVMLGISLRNGALWGGFIAYAVLDGVLGASVNFLQAWFAVQGARLGNQIFPLMAAGLHALAGWFSGPPEEGVELAVELLNLAFLAEVENQVADLGLSLGVAAMGVAPDTITEHDYHFSNGAAACMDGGYGLSKPLTPGAPVAFNVCNGNSNQLWQGFNTSGCTQSNWHQCPAGVTFQIMNDGLCLAPRNEDTNTAQDLILQWCNGSTYQQWDDTSIWYPGGHRIQLVNKGSGLCVDVALDSSPIGDPFRDVGTCGLDGHALGWEGFGQFGETGNGGGGGGNGVSLRIMPLGDSITEGAGSSDNSGYRCELGSYLGTYGYSYDMVGSLRNGSNCSDTDHEGHSGWVISQIQSIEGCKITQYQPNVVLLDIGTNDINRGGAVAPAVSELQSLVNSIFNDDPGVTILVAGLIPTPDATVAANMGAFNGQVHTWVDQQQVAGKRIAYADMSNVELGDGLHPSTFGYAQMADVWRQVIDGVGTMIQPANAPKTGCGGTGVDAWAPNWQPKGIIASGPGGTATEASGPGNLALNGTTSGYYDMNGDGKDDFVAMTDTTGALTVWLNGGQSPSGAVTWQSMGRITGGVGVNSAHVRLADAGGDGKADYLKLADNGAVTLYPNLGPGCGGWCWGSPVTIALGVGASFTQVRFADVNADKLADYLVVTGTYGHVDAWIAGGQACNYCWTEKRNLAGGGTETNPVFPDLNADRLADYVNVHSDSSAGAWLNPGLANLINGGGWVNKGTIALGVGVSGAKVQFGDINGDGKDDYLVVDQSTGATQEWQNDQPTSGAANGWAWTSKGTITQGASAWSWRVLFAPLSDSDKLADYAVVNADSSVKFWKNGGANGGAQNGWLWTGPVTLALGVGAPGSQIVFADLNADGRSDYLDIDPADGSIKAWLSGGGTSWTPLGKIALGVGSPGNAIRIADINADGRADYIRVNPNSSAQAWTNGGQGCGGWCWAGGATIALGVGAPGSQIQFADLNGDKQADYLNIKPDSSIDAWLNHGLASLTSNGLGWTAKGTVALGVGTPGSWIQLADITGDNKADYLSVDPSNGVTKTWLNGG
jgi:lysophospholipase L1-like esterase